MDLLHRYSYCKPWFGLEDSVCPAAGSLLGGAAGGFKDVRSKPSPDRVKRQSNISKKAKKKMLISNYRRI